MRLVADKRLLRIISRFPSRRILVLGDLMLDHFIRGGCSRISPEAPVPVVRVREESHAPGGAGNVCSNLCSLGAEVSVLGLVGDDLAGNQLLSDLEQRGVEVSGVLVNDSRITTRKTRIVADHQQVVRVDRETPHSISPASQRKLLSRLKAMVRGAHALVISDYGKGLVTPGVVQNALKVAHRARLPVLVDPKIEHFRRYRGVDCITPNFREAWAGMRLLPSTDEEAVDRLGARILKALRLRSVLITRGEKGMSLFEAGRRPRHIPTRAKEVFDVTGAGDTVVSVMALALASGAALFEAAVTANTAAGVVVAKLGTATVTTAEIRRALRQAAADAPASDRSRR